MNNSTCFFKQHEESTPVPHAFKAVFFAANTLVALVSAVGNTLVIIAFLRSQNLRTSSNYYITNMAFSDLLYVVAKWPLYSRSRLSHAFQCKVVNYLGPVSYSVSIESLVLITVDRFIATVFPLKIALISGRIRALFILLTWIIPLGAFVPLLYYTRNAETDELNLCSTDSSGLAGSIYLIVTFVIFYPVPLIAIIILNVRIMKSLRRTNPVIQGNGHSNRRQKQNRRVMKILISIIVSFLVCWTLTYVAVFLLMFIQHFSEKGNILEMILSFCPYFLPFLSTAFNPLILFTFSTNYRQALKDCLRLAFGKCRSCFVLQEVAREENVELSDLKQ